MGIMEPIETELAVAIDAVDFHWSGSPGTDEREFCFENMNFELATREKVFLFGESGSGKSTLLGLIAGTLLPSNSGNIRILGNDFTNLSASRRDSFRAEHMGVIFQMFNLIPYLSAIENIILPLNFASERRKRAGNSATLHRQKGLELMEGLGLSSKALAGRKPSELSVGQQQRVAAARALIGEPELIIADEPTSALDRNHQQEFVDLLFGLVERSGSTLLMVSHDETLAGRFDRMVSMEDISPEVLKGNGR